MNNKQRLTLVIMSIINEISIVIGLTTEAYSMPIFAVQYVTTFTFLILMAQD